jgi:sulfane dehydrogenase subunit SoxC
MSKMDSPQQSRRSFLAAGAGVAASVLAKPALAGGGNPANQPPNVPEWTKSLGEGVAVRPYGKPSKF